MKILVNLKNILTKFRQKFKLLKYKKYINNSQNSNGVKNIISKDCSVRFDSAFEKRKKEIQKEIELIVVNYKNNPQELISYAESKNTPVYKINNANKILAAIDEEEGFITPKKGLKALYLNLILNKKISAEFKECFIMRDLAFEPYYIIHQFYNWYAFKSDFAGYEYKAQEKMKRIIRSKNRAKEINTLCVSDILSVKEAIRRDIEAVNFVIDFAKNTEGAKKAFQKIIQKSSAANI